MNRPKAAKRLYCLDARTVTPHFPGIGRYTWAIARAMAPQLEKDERLLLLRHQGQPTWLDLRSLAGPQVELIETGASPFSLRQQWQIPRVLRERGVHVYHSPYYVMPYSPRTPTLLTVFDLIPIRLPDSHSPLQRWMFSAFLRLAVRAATLLTTVSHATAQDLERILHVEPGRARVVYPGATTPAEATGRRLRSGLPDAYALTVCSNKPHKNLVRLVEAWSRLQHRELPLVIAGSWDARYPQARERAATLGRPELVHFLGPVSEDELQCLYRNARLFVFPSLYEGFGLPVAEAMAHGLPIACSNVSSLPEVAGRAALFNPLDIRAMANAVDELLGDPDRMTALGEHGRIRASGFTWEQAARETLALYRVLAP